MDTIEKLVLVLGMAGITATFVGLDMYFEITNVTAGVDVLGQITYSGFGLLLALAGAGMVVLAAVIASRY